jgi:hypothetical protein
MVSQIPKTKTPHVTTNYKDLLDFQGETSDFFKVKSSIIESSRPLSTVQNPALTQRFLQNFDVEKIPEHPA